MIHLRRIAGSDSVPTITLVCSTPPTDMKEAATPGEQLIQILGPVVVEQFLAEIDRVVRQAVAHGPTRGEASLKMVVRLKMQQVEPPGQESPPVLQPEL